MKNILLILFLFPLFLSAQTPDWLDFNERHKLYPHTYYITGFSWDKNMKDETPNQLLERLEDNAITELTESVQVTVESVTTHNTLELNDKLLEQFRQSSTSFSKIDMSGLKTETYFDKRKKTGYALAYVKKDELITYYENQVSQKLNKLGMKIKTAEQYVSLNDETNALSTYYSCFPLIREIEGDITMVVLLKASEIDLAAFNEYDLKIKKAISSINRSEQLELDEVCQLMADGLKLQTGTMNNAVILSNFTYQDTKMGSPFSRRFKNGFEKELISRAGYNITGNAKPGESYDYKYILSGTYWEESNSLKIIAILKDIKTGKPIASVEGFLPLQWLKRNNVSWKPQNFEDAYVSMLAFKKNEIINGGMKIEVWTNKGNVSPIFEENDTLQFYVRVNHECYIRIINHFANGTRVLLVDNLYVGSDKVNKVIKVPGNFLCAPPFGTEVFQVNAQTVYFNPLEVKNEYGYDFIVGELDYIVSNTRGFKRLDNEDLKAENRIIVTTMKRLESGE